MACNHGQKKKRYLHTAILKARVIDEYLEEKENNPNITKEKIACCYRISQGQLSDWLSKAEKVVEA